jgi:hypothetical protein
MGHQPHRGQCREESEIRERKEREPEWDIGSKVDGGFRLGFSEWGEGEGVQCSFHLQSSTSTLFTLLHPFSPLPPPFTGVTPLKDAASRNEGSGVRKAEVESMCKPGPEPRQEPRQEPRPEPRPQPGPEVFAVPI